MEDSESLIRAYKKKKTELEELKEKYYRVETDLFTERQKNMMLEDELRLIKVDYKRVERELK